MQDEDSPSQTNGVAIQVDTAWHVDDELAALAAEPQFARGTREVVRELASLDLERDTMRSEDVAGIAHDLNGPLANIALETTMLREKLAAGAAIDAVVVVERIARNVEYLDRLVQDLVDTCAFDDGHFELHREPTELGIMLHQIVTRVVPARDRVRVALDAPVSIELDIDSLRIERVVANLLINALKFAPKGSKILVRLTVAESSCQISVTDAGPGMSPADKADIFKRHARARTRHTPPGSGLGLHLSRKIVLAHGGRIDVDTVAGVGSCFYFELPRPDAAVTGAW